MKEEIYEKTAKVKKLRSRLEDMLEEAIAMSGSCNISYDLPGALADMIKDLAAAEESITNECKAVVEIEYRKKIIEAMEESQEEERRGYTSSVIPYVDPLVPAVAPPVIPPVMGYTHTMIGNGTGISSGYNVGNNVSSGYDAMHGNTGRGRMYDEYRSMRRNYQEAQNPENQRMMEESRDKLFDDIEGMIMEAWPDMQPQHKQKYLQKGSKLMSKLQQM